MIRTVALRMPSPREFVRRHSPTATQTESDKRREPEYLGILRLKRAKQYPIGRSLRVSGQPIGHPIKRREFACSRALASLAAHALSRAVQQAPVPSPGHMVAPIAENLTPASRMTTALWVHKLPSPPAQIAWIRDSRLGMSHCAVTTICLSRARVQILRVPRARVRFALFYRAGPTPSQGTI